MPKTSKKYTEVMSTVMPPGTDALLEALKPSYVSRSAYIRDLLTKALEAEKAKQCPAETPRARAMKAFDVPPGTAEAVTEYDHEYVAEEYWGGERCVYCGDDPH